MKKADTEYSADVIRLSINDQLLFAQAIIDPPPITPALKRAFEKHDRLVKADPVRSDLTSLDVAGQAIQSD